MTLFGDSTFDFFLKAFKVRTKECQRDEAINYAGALKHFFAVELTYKKKPIRLIVAASDIPSEFTGANNGRQLPASDSETARTGSGAITPAVTSGG